MTNIGDQTFEHYTIDLFRKWGIGSKDKNNGVMIFWISKAEGPGSKWDTGLKAPCPTENRQNSK